MVKKRRIFDIDMPEGDETFPAGKVSDRKGPMASAIGETSEAVRERAEIEAQIRAENDRLAHEHVRLKALGLVVDLIPTEAVVMTKLVRDRFLGPDPEQAELRESIRAIGLSNPIRVEAAGDQYELIQGYRRLQAFRALAAETGAEDWAKIPAVVVTAGEGIEGLYRRMVDENLVRKDISFAEMAQLALDFAAEPGTTAETPEKAVSKLFTSASYQKRSYIRGFIRVMESLGGDLRFAAEIPRSLGLALANRLDEVEGLSGAIKADLAPLDNRSVREEMDVLRRWAGPEQFETVPAGKGSGAKPAPKPGQAKTSFQFERREGRAKCTAAAGRLEIRLNRDFSTVDRIRLEQAVRAMLDQLD